MKSRDLIRGLEAAGWTCCRIRGSHHVFVHLAVASHHHRASPQKGSGQGAGSGVAEARRTDVGGPMRYPVLIEAGDERTAWGVIVPDLPGCFSAADTLNDALSAAEESALAWIDAALDEGRSIPSPFRVLLRHRRSSPRLPVVRPGFLPTSALIHLCWTTPSSESTSACRVASWPGWMRRPGRPANPAPVTSPISQHWAERAPCRAQPMVGCCSRVAR